MCEVMIIDISFIDLYQIFIIVGRFIFFGEVDQKYVVVVIERLVKDFGFFFFDEVVD